MNHTFLPVAGLGKVLPIFILPVFSVFVNAPGYPSVFWPSGVSSNDEDGLRGRLPSSYFTHRCGIQLSATQPHPPTKCQSRISGDIQSGISGYLTIYVVWSTSLNKSTSILFSTYLFHRYISSLSFSDRAVVQSIACAKL